jgi:thiol-disulfide isomerase/thioredoxin
MNLISRMSRFAVYLFALAALQQYAMAQGSNDEAASSNDTQSSLVEALKDAQLLGCTPEELEEQLEGKLVGLYFTAKWCAPCRSFSPKLVAFRNENAERFQFVMMSQDEDLASQEAYMEHAKFNAPAVRFDDPFIAQCARQFQVGGIPTLIVFNTKGEYITTYGQEQMTTAFYEDDMTVHEEIEDGPIWLEMIEQRQEQFRAEREENMAELNDVFEEYADFPHIDELGSCMGYFGRSSKTQEILALLGREIGEDWDNKQHLLERLITLAVDLKPQRDGYRGMLEGSGAGPCFVELGKISADNEAIYETLLAFAQGKRGTGPTAGNCRTWGLIGLVAAAVHGNDEAFELVADWRNSLRISNGPLTICPVLREYCDEGNPRAVDLAAALYREDSYYIYVIFPCLVKPSLSGNETALEVMGEMARLPEDEGRDYEKYAVQVLEAAAENGHDAAQDILEDLAEPEAETTID